MQIGKWPPIFRRPSTFPYCRKPPSEFWLSPTLSRFISSCRVMFRRPPSLRDFSSISRSRSTFSSIDSLPQPPIYLLPSSLAVVHEDPVISPKKATVTSDFYHRSAIFRRCLYLLVADSPSPSSDLPSLVCHRYSPNRSPICIWSGLCLLDFKPIGSDVFIRGVFVRF